MLLKKFIFLFFLCSCVPNKQSAETSTSITDKANDTTVTSAPAQVSSSSLQIFPSDNIWNKDISLEPVDPRSAAYVASLGAGQLHASFGTVWEGAPNGIPYVMVTGQQKKVPVSFDYFSESDAGPYPIPADAPIEGGTEGTGDRHVIVVDVDHHLLYELYDAHPQSDGSWRAGSGAIFNLDSNNLRPDGWTSADAAGLPLFPGLVRYDEVINNKEIDHALRFAGGLINQGHVWPARHSDGTSNDPNVPPMGARFRLKMDFDISGFPASVQVILRALKKYGMFLADTGARSWMISGAPDQRWNDRELNSLEKIPSSAFEVIKTGPISY